MKVLVETKVRGHWADIIRWITGFGAQVVEAMSFRMATRLLNADPEIDVVLVDTEVAEESGAKLLRTIKSDYRLSNVPVIMAGTGFSQDTVRDCLALDVDDIMMLPTAPKTLEAKIRRAAANGKKRVLVVDDEETIRDILSQFLVYERYLPVCAESGPQALQILKEQPIHAVVTDVVMPGMTGIQLLDTIKRDYPGLPVILITGYSGQCGPELAIKSGADGFFAKPFNNTELVYILRRAIGSRRAARTPIEPSVAPPVS
jgi:CheY-like chemotaxis protein